MKSDNLEVIGKHAFEIAGLGKAPFKFVGYEYKTYRSCADAPEQVGGSCDFCGQGIKHFCWVEDSEGKRFKVGPECIKKSNDNGIVKKYKEDPNVRKLKREQRHAREKIKIEELKVIIEENKERLSNIDHPNSSSYFEDKTFLDYVEWMMSHAGNSGKIKMMKEIKKVLSL